MYRVTASAIDFYSPDIYWPDFEYWMRRYKFHGNAIFVPEARLETAPLNAFYAYGESKAFGFSPFGIDSIDVLVDHADNPTALEQTYQTLDDLSYMLLQAQALGHTRGLVLHVSSPRPTPNISTGWIPLRSDVVPFLA